MAKRIYTVKTGDSLLSIATNELQDATRWGEIAYINRLSELARLIPGTSILLPVDGAPLDVTVREGVTPAMTPKAPPWGTYAAVAALLMLALAVTR